MYSSRRTILFNRLVFSESAVCQHLLRHIFRVTLDANRILIIIRFKFTRIRLNKIIIIIIFFKFKINCDVKRIIVYKCSVNMGWPFRRGFRVDSPGGGNSRGVGREPEWRGGSALLILPPQWDTASMKPSRPTYSNPECPGRGLSCSPRETIESSQARSPNNHHLDHRFVEGNGLVRMVYGDEMIRSLQGTKTFVSSQAIALQRSLPSQVPRGKQPSANALRRCYRLSVTMI